VSAVRRLLVRERGLDAPAGRLLRSLFERRSQADYGLDEVPEHEARRAVEDAEAVVDIIEIWLEDEH
jgi:hypothetical protein